MNPTVKEPKKRFMTLKRREACLGWLFVSPALIGFSIFTFGSILYSFYLSLTDYDLLSAPKWVGFDNYIRAFTKDQYFYKYFGNKEGLFKAICDYRRIKFFEDISIPIELMALDFRSYLVHTLLNFYHQIMQPENSAFMRLVLEQSQRNPELAQHIHERGPVHVQSAIATALEQADAQGLLHCENPQYSAQLYFGILRNLEWRILMGIPVQEDDQEIDKYISYCVDRFLDGHQKV